MMNTMLKVFKESVDFYMERTGWSSEDVIDTYYDDIMETVINDAGLEYDDFRIRLFEKTIQTEIKK